MEPRKVMKYSDYTFGYLPKGVFLCLECFDHLSERSTCPICAKQPYQWVVFEGEKEEVKEVTPGTFISLMIRKQGGASRHHSLKEEKRYMDFVFPPGTTKNMYDLIVWILEHIPEDRRDVYSFLMWDRLKDHFDQYTKLTDPRKRTKKVSFMWGVLRNWEKAYKFDTMTDEVFIRFTLLHNLMHNYTKRRISCSDWKTFMNITGGTNDPKKWLQDYRRAMLNNRR